MITEREIIKRLQEGRITLPPLVFQVSPWEVRETENRDTSADAIMQVSWGEQQEEFAVEFKAVSTPKVIREALYRVRAAARGMDLSPMIIVPYLSEDALSELEREGVSGVDLCGNGVVVVPGRLLICRTGKPNRFPRSAPIKNIYRRNSSMVARLFLVRPMFNRVTSILEEINRCNPLGDWAGSPMTLSTVSKALRGLEDDLIVGREASTARLLQAEKLMERLVENYVRPRLKRIINWKFPDSLAGVTVDDILKNAFSSEIPAVITGSGSVSQYAVMQAGETLAIYCPDPDGWLAHLPGTQSDRFPTISLIETEEASVYFDPRPGDGRVWASPVQTYLELMAGDKRDRETALQVKDTILRQLGENQP